MSRMPTAGFAARMLAWTIAILAASSAIAHRALSSELAPRYEKHWVWVMSNLLVDAEAERVSGIIDKAAKAGFNGLVLSDYKCNFLERMPDRYFANVRRVMEKADQSGIEIVPCLFPIGYSNGLLSNDVNLAEGLPVVDAPYRIRKGKGVLLSDRASNLKNGGLEETKGDAFVGFGYQDNPGKCTFADRSVRHGGRMSCRMENFAAGAVCRLIQSVKVRPKSCWRLSCWIKTEGFQNTGEFRLHAIGGSGRTLTFFEGGIKETQDWTKVNVVFNSLDETSVNLYAGTWGGKSGKFWLDDLALEEVSLMNILRREGCPVKLTSADGSKTYKEGTDFETLVDPKLGRVPYEGEYDFDHPGPEIAVKAGSKIKEGDKILVSWYHPVPTHGTNVACCLSEPKVYDLLRNQATRVNDLFHPKAFFMQHDELRVANWCRRLPRRGSPRESSWPRTLASAARSWPRPIPPRRFSSGPTCSTQTITP